MSDLSAFARDIVSEPFTPKRRYTICTLVSDLAAYSIQVQQFRASGFDQGCEYLYVDNSQGNQMDAFAAYNHFLTEARGQYILLCHQDLNLLSDGRLRLDEVLGELTELDPNWGLCGNAGAKADGSLALRITDPHGSDQNVGGPFPTRVVSLDENFIVARRSANLAMSHDLSGFHLYGSDLCIIADVLGLSAYVIDFHLEHKSGGNPDESFATVRRASVKKWRRAFRPRWQHVTTLRPFYLSGTEVREQAARLLRHIRARLRSA